MGELDGINVGELVGCSVGEREEGDNEDINVGLRVGGRFFLRRLTNAALVLLFSCIMVAFVCMLFDSSIMVIQCVWKLEIELNETNFQIFFFKR